MIWQYVAAVQGQSQGQTGVEIKSTKIYDVPYKQAKVFGRRQLEEGGWLKVIADDMWQIEDTRQEDMGR